MGDVIEKISGVLGGAPGDWIEQNKVLSLPVGVS
jgi:hypothetical protein